MFLTSILCGLFPVPTAYRLFQWILLVTSWQVALGPCIREEIEAWMGGGMTQTPYFTVPVPASLGNALVIHMLTVNVKTCHFFAAGVFLSVQRLAVRAVHLLFAYLLWVGHCVQWPFVELIRQTSN